MPGAANANKGYCTQQKLLHHRSPALCSLPVGPEAFVDRRERPVPDVKLYADRTGKAVSEKCTLIDELRLA